MRYSAVLFASFCAVPFSSSAFSIYSARGNGSLKIEKGIARRQFLEGLLVAGSAAFFGISPAFADVSDGNMLPQGAAQFSRVLNIKSNLADVSKRVKEHSSEIDSKEWDNIGAFLRKLYSCGDDMKAIAAGIADPEKKRKAEEDIKLLQKYAQAGDLPVNKKDADGFLVIAKKASELVDDFFDLLSDVPDEI